jgi:hypothetical protein
MANYTREQPKEVSLPIRLPLVGIPNQRAGSPDEDSRLINGYVEMGQDEVLRVVKRPGLAVHRTFSGYGGGMKGEYSVFTAPIEGGYSARIYYQGTLLGSSSAVGSVLLGALDWSFDIVPTGAESTALFLHNRRTMYTYDATNGLRYMPFQTLAEGPLTCSISSGLPEVTTASTATLTAYSTATGTGIPAATFIESIDSATQFTMSANATATNAAASLTFALGGPPTRAGVTGIATIYGGVSEVPQLAYGVVDLNKCTYLFTYRQIIAGSDIDDPRAWNPLNIIYAYANQDDAVAIAKQLSYIVAFKGYSTEFFRDVAASPGSPLERLEGLRLSAGCFDGRTVADVDGTLIWCSQTESGLKSVWRLRDTKADEIAWPSVRRILEQLSPTHGFAFSAAGHTFYVLTDPAAGVSLVYDLTPGAQFWSYWNALGQSHFPFVSATNFGGETYLQHENNGKIYRFDPDVLTDDGSAFDMDIYPPQFDANMRTSKYVARMYVVGDQAAGSVLQVRSTDSDQTVGSWTNFREFDLSKPRPDLYDCGSFTKRFYHFRHSSATRCRLTAVEMDLLPGTL